MALLRIQLLGAVRVFHQDHTYDARLTQTLQPLLAWLVLNRKKTHAREALTELFWGEQREDRALDLLDAGDLVFFDVESDDGARLDHVGMYLGTDLSGARRFISSRKTVNGPTLADAGGRSILNGTGTYARRFRAARRL